MSYTKNNVKKIQTKNNCKIACKYQNFVVTLHQEIKKVSKQTDRQTNKHFSTCCEMQRKAGV